MCRSGRLHEPPQSITLLHRVSWPLASHSPKISEVAMHRGCYAETCRRCHKPEHRCIASELAVGNVNIVRALLDSGAGANFECQCRSVPLEALSVALVERKFNECPHSESVSLSFERSIGKRERSQMVNPLGSSLSAATKACSSRRE